MLIDAERIRPEDKPLVDLALKTAEKCDSAHATAWLMLPPPVHAKLLDVKRQSDALNIQLAKGKISFGEYNQKSIQFRKQVALAFASLSEGQGDRTAQTALKIPELKPPKPTVQNATPQTSTSHEVRIALVIGESRYENLPKLLNPEKDARSIAETLQKMGYNTQLLLDVSEGGIRKEIRKFAASQAKPTWPWFSMRDTARS
jgi:Caspase domain